MPTDAIVVLAMMVRIAVIVPWTYLPNLPRPRAETEMRVFRPYDQHRGQSAAFCWKWPA